MRILIEFQSLSRDSGRLNLVEDPLHLVEDPCFNPSVGIRGV